MTTAQREAVLARTAIDSGDPLDSSSKGWQRINLARALGQEVTVNDRVVVIGVQDASSPVVRTEASDQGGVLDKLWAVLSKLLLVAVPLVLLFVSRETLHLF